MALKIMNDSELMQLARGVTLDDLLCTLTVKCDEKYGFPIFPSIDVEKCVGWLLLNVPHEAFRRVSKRRITEDFSHTELTNLQAGEVYSEKVGDADYILEEEGKWNQIGGEKRQGGYRNSNGRIRVIMSYDVLRFPQGRQIACKFAEVNPKIELKAIGNDLRAILVQKKKSRKLYVWQSWTVDVHGICKSHNPSL